MVDKISRSDARMIEADIQAALKAVGAKYGITITNGAIRYNAEMFKISVEGKVADRARRDAIITSMTTPEAVKVDETKFVSHGKVFTVVDYKPNRPQYPFVGANERGTRYKFTRADVVNNIINQGK